MIEIVKELIQLVGTASPVLYIFAVSYAIGKVLPGILFFSFFVYAVRCARQCAWWMVRDEIVERFRTGAIKINEKGEVEEKKV